MKAKKEETTAEFAEKHRKELEICAQSISAMMQIMQVNRLKIEAAHTSSKNIEIKWKFKC